MVDFVEHYARCFIDYSKKCTRLHFFSLAFSRNDLENLIINEDTFLSSNKLQDNYIGFLVVKPMPETIIGRTCLKVYDDNRNYKRNFPTTRRYDVNLFGIQLEIHSLAFQEQDKIVSACATSALWTTFHGTINIWNHYIPSPSEITRAAYNYFPDHERMTPNKGLTEEQIAGAINNLNLEHHYIPLSVEQINNEYGYPTANYLKNVIYAYIKDGFPIILVGYVAKNTINSNSKFKIKLNEEDLHAVTITGYHISDNKVEYYNEISTTASYLDKIYVHDDGVGPFARMELDNEEVVLINNEPIHNTLSTSWTEKNDEIGHYRFVPEYLIIPVYHKVRISYTTIEECIESLSEFLKWMVTQINLKLQNFLWDIHITTVNKYKNELFHNIQLDSESRKSILFTQLPKYLWKARLQSIYDNEPIADFIFDATDLQQSSLLTYVVCFENHFLSILKDISHGMISKYYQETEDIVLWKLLKKIKTSENECIL